LLLQLRNALLQPAHLLRLRLGVIGPFRDRELVLRELVELSAPVVDLAHVKPQLLRNIRRRSARLISQPYRLSTERFGVTLPLLRHPDTSLCKSSLLQISVHFSWVTRVANGLYIPGKERTQASTNSLPEKNEVFSSQRGIYIAPAPDLGEALAAPLVAAKWRDSNRRNPISCHCGSSFSSP